jgi:hypothetical protein
MKHFLNIKGQLVELDDLLDEKNWQPKVRAIAYILFVVGVFMTAYVVLSLGR